MEGAIRTGRGQVVDAFSIDAQVRAEAERLGPVAEQVAREWGVALGQRLATGRYSHVVEAGEAILKLVPHLDDEALHEAEALAVWRGDGAVRLLRHDGRRRALLLERAVPGYDASALPEDEAMRVALDVGRRLWRVRPPGPFRRAGGWVGRWLRTVEATGHPYVPIAQDVFGSMSIRDDTLVHGDLHHHNLLRDRERWVAIDPKPYLADPEFDVAPMLWNPIGYLPTRESTERRIATLAGGGLDERRIREWAIVRGTYLGLPLDPDEDEATARQLSVVRALLGP